MGKSSISKPHRRPELATELGRAIRARRLAVGLSQARLGAPLSRSFVSQVERGRVLPSLPALVLFAERLGLAPGELLDSVNYRADRAVHCRAGRRRGRDVESSSTTAPSPGRSVSGSGSPGGGPA